MTFEVKLSLIKNERLFIVSIHSNFHQNQNINECLRKKKAKFPESRKPEIFCEM